MLGIKSNTEMTSSIWEVCICYIQKLHPVIERSLQILAGVRGMSWNLFPVGNKSGDIIFICSGVERAGKGWCEAPGFYPVSCCDCPNHGSFSPASLSTPVGWSLTTCDAEKPSACGGSLSSRKEPTDQGRRAEANED